LNVWKKYSQVFLTGHSAHLGLFETSSPLKFFKRDLSPIVFDEIANVFPDNWGLRPTLMFFEDGDDLLKTHLDRNA